MATQSTMLPLGTKAPDFSLPDVVSERTITLSDFDSAAALVVVFLCRHCPYVQHVKQEISRLAADYQPRGVAMAGVASNDVETYPEDAPESLAEFARQEGWEFPLLYDETQDVARAYSAACTPDFFLFDAKRELVYRGQLDNSRPGGEIPVTGSDLRAALDAVLEGQAVNPDQKPSVGCSIKWKR